MEQIELAHWVIRESLKLDYSFTTLIFATLALSIQFSPGMGTIYPLLLIVAWTLLMISALASGYRLMRLQYFYQLDVQVSKAVRKNNLDVVKKGRELISGENKYLVKIYYFRLWTFLLGLLFNLSFAIANYLTKSNFKFS